MAEATYQRRPDEYPLTVEAAKDSGELIQLPNGKAGYCIPAAGAEAGDRVAFKSWGVVNVPKATGIVLLAGGKAYWDHSANNVTYKSVNDRDFYVGTVVADAASGDTTVTIDLNADPTYLIDLARDPFKTAIVLTAGTPALNRRGGAHNMLFSATNEAQKVDALSKEGFVVGANAIVEMRIDVVSDGAGSAADANIGIASATHATDADSIAQHLFLHLDANNANINFQSKDGTTTVASTDSTIDYTEGTPFEVWFDLRTPTAVKIYVNGVRVLSGTTFDVSAAASVWKLLAHIEKTASTDAYEIDVDWLRVRIAEQ